MPKFSILIIVSLVLIMGCGESKVKEDESRYSDDRVVAKVDDQVLTMGDVYKRYNGISFDNIQDEYEAKKNYIEQSIERFLHIKAAREAGLSYDPDSTTILQYLFQELYKHDADVEVEASDSYVRDFFDKYGGEIQFGPLVVRDSALIFEIYDLLEKGADWDSLVEENSLLKTGRKRGGSLGYVPFGQYDLDIQLPAYDLEIGQYSRPFRAKFEWCIVKLFDRIKDSREYLDQDWSAYKNAASNYYQIQQTDEYKKKLLDDYDYGIDWNTIDMMIQISDSVRSTGALPDSMPTSAYLDKSAFDKRSLDRKMVKFKDGGITIGDYLDLMESYNPYRTPELRDRFNMEILLKDLATRKIMTMRALELGCDTLQSFKDALKTQTENWLIQAFNRKLIAKADTVTDKEIEEYYNEHPDDCYRPEQVRVSAISLKTEEEAKEILEKIKMGANFYSLAEKYSTDKKTASEGGDLNFFTEKRFTEIYDAARGLDIGEVGGPVKMYGNYWIFRVRQRLTKELRPLHLVRSNIQSKLSADRKIQAVRSWVRENKKKAEYFVDLQPLRDDLGIAADDSTRVDADKKEEL